MWGAKTLVTGLHSAALRLRLPPSEVSANLARKFTAAEIAEVFADCLCDLAPAQKPPVSTRVAVGNKIRPVLGEEPLVGTIDTF